MPEIAGMTAGLIGFVVGHLWYIYTIVRGQTTAHFLTWSLSAIMSGITLFFYTEAGAEDSIYVLWGDLIGFSLISVAAWLYRHESFRLLTWENVTIAVSAATAFGIYLITGSAVASLVAAITAEALVLYPTIKKTWEHPEQEEFIAWTGTVSGNALNILAIQGLCTLEFEKINMVEAGYVLAVLIIDGIVWGLLVRHKLTKVAS